MSEDKFPNRRQFLTAATVGGTALLAGCGSDSGNNSSNGTATPRVTTHSGPADFRASLTGPSQITLGKSFRLALTVTNIGGQSGSLDTTVSVTEGKSTLSRSLQQESIGPGESVTMRTDPIQFDTADTYTFTVGISNVTHAVTVQPKTGSLGTSFNLSDALKGTVTSIEFHPAILYSPSNSEQTFLQNAPSNRLLAVTRADLENVGSESASLDGEFQLKNGEVQQTLGSNTPLSAAKIDGTPLTNLQLSSGQQRSGWVLGEIPRSNARKAVTVIYQRDTFRTPPEIEWTSTPQQGTRNLPQFAIESFQLPNTTMQGEDATANVTISNKGNSTRTFRGLVESRAGNSENWGGVAPITARVQPGQSIQRNVTINSSSNGSVSYRLAPFNRTKTVEYVPPTFAFGESYTTTQNVDVTVSDLQAAQSVQLSGLGEPERRTPSSGNRFVLARVQVAVVGESQRMPLTSEFLLQSGSQTFTQAGLTQPLVAPVEGTPYGGGTYDPETGTTASWYVVWSAPQQVSLSNMSVGWTSQDSSTGAQGETARWTEGGRTTSR